MNANTYSFQRFIYNRNTSRYGALSIPFETAESMTVFLVRDNGYTEEVARNFFMLDNGYLVINDVDAMESNYGTEWKYICVQRQTSLKQDAAFVNGRYLDVKKVEGALDNLSRQIQDLSTELENTIRINKSEFGEEVPSIPVKALRSGMILGFDEDGNIVTPYSVDGLDNDIQAAKASAGEAAKSAKAAQDSAGSAESFAGQANTSYQLASQQNASAAQKVVEAQAALQDTRVALSQTLAAQAIAMRQVDLAKDEVENAKLEVSKANEQANRSAASATESKGYMQESERFSEVSEEHESKAQEFRNQAEQFRNQAEDEADKAKRYYIPSVDDEGNLSWTSSRPDMDPVEPVNVYGDTVKNLVEKVKQIEAETNTKVARIEYESDNMLYYYDSYGNPLGSVGPVAGGTGTGGGGGAAASVLKITNPYGTNSLKFPSSSRAVINLEWESIDVDNNLPTGSGSMTVKVGGKTVIKSRSIQQGPIQVDVTEWLNPGDITLVNIEITDIYGMRKPIAFNVNVVAIGLVSEFDEKEIRYDSFIVPVIPTGDCQKIMNLSVDGEVVDSKETSANGRRVNTTCPRLEHGSHDIKLWFIADIDGEEVPSPTLEYKVIAVADSTQPVIVVRNDSFTIEQYYTYQIRYQVWSQSVLDRISLVHDGKTVEIEKPSAGEEQELVWAVSNDNIGQYVYEIKVGSVTETINLDVTQSTLNIQPATEGLELYLSSKGHVKGDEISWSYGDVQVQFSDSFNGIADGWQNDSEGIPVMRLVGDDRITIPVYPFSKDIMANGKTIEFEFATHDVFDYNAKILECMAGGIGLEVTAQAVTLRSSANRLYTQYKEDEHVRVSFVISSRSNIENERIVYCFVDGIMSGAYQYAPGSIESFMQGNPSAITIGSNDCVTDIYAIRIYDQDITRYEVFDNMLMDMQNGSELLATYNANQIYFNDNVSADRLIGLGLPVLKLVGPLPMEKGTPTTMEGEYIDPSDSSKSFTFTGASVDIQGTSSKDYPVSNFKIKFKNGFRMESGTASKYSINGGIGASTFTFKADYASSEGANNVELVRLYDAVINYTANGATPIYRTPAQDRNPNCRQGIDGFPIAIFHDDGNGFQFVGKYNFNYDKGNDEVFGFDNGAAAGITGDQSWEITDNQYASQMFKEANFNDYEGIRSAFELRYPDEKEVEWNDPAVVAKLKEMISWVASTDTSVDGLSEEEKAARLEKFRSEFENYFDLNSALFYYIFTDVFLMVDSRAKNAFPSRFVEDAEGNGKWCWLPYDMDTAMGIDNGGQLLFGYSLDDTMQIYGADVYNGQKSVLWNNLRDCFQDELVDMYSRMRGIPLFTFDRIEKQFEDHQSKWPIALWNEDQYYKYIYTYLFGDRFGNRQDRMYMLQGSKEAQRKWWLSNRFKYIDSKYYMQNDQLTFRAYANNGAVENTFEITPYADIYAAVEFGNEGVTARNHVRTEANQTAVIKFPAIENPKNIVVNIYGASQLKDVGDISGFKPDEVNVASAVRLQSLKVGDGTEGYVNESLKKLSIGDNTLLRSIDARNCPNYNGTLDASGCSSLEEILLDGSGVAGVVLPDSGSIRTLHLPDTITALELRNQVNLTDYSVAGYSSLESIWITRPSAAVKADFEEIINTAKDGARLYLTGFDMEFDNAEELATLMASLSRFTGFTGEGPVLSGTVYLHDTIRKPVLDQYSALYPDLRIVPDRVVVEVKFMSEDGQTVIEQKEVTYLEPFTFTGTEPTKDMTVDKVYSFVGWSLDPNSEGQTVTGFVADSDKTYYAFFYWQTRQYTITFVNDDGSVLQSGLWDYGTIPVYSGSTPVTSDTSGDYGDFKGWDYEIVSVDGNKEYKATYVMLASQTRKLIQKTITNAYHSQVKTVGTNALAYCSNLVTANFPECKTLGQNAFFNCRKLAKIDIPACDSIGIQALNLCVTLQSVSLPMCKRIEMNAFNDCSALSEIYIGTSNCTLYNSAVFANAGIKSNAGSIYVPSEYVDTYKASTNWNYFANRIFGYDFVNNTPV